ncbi:MAG: hypothetical protein L7S42_08650, partial [Flavobacteriaceae bacterium]|nr:hypothetical protein [Flavobacteriaceae bacterium]
GGVVIDGRLMLWFSGFRFEALASLSVSLWGTQSVGLCEFTERDYSKFSLKEPRLNLLFNKM